MDILIKDKKQTDELGNLLKMLSIQSKVDYLGLMKGLEDSIKAHGLDINDLGADIKNVDKKLEVLRNVEPIKKEDLFTEDDIKKIIKKAAKLAKPDEADIIRRIMKELPAEGPPGPPGPPGDTDTAQNIRDKLQTLIKDERLDASAIKNLGEFLLSDDKFKKGLPSTVVTRFPKTSVEQRLTIHEAVGDVDDSNKDFHFINKPTYINVNGLLIKEGTNPSHEWSWSGNIATLPYPVGTDGFIQGVT